ncbi:leucine-rich repeat-containing protein 24-like [Mya arenaria]|uniref:leucine-rich repeat-containing protein 24-like n=1 Tax=Mya arenaria TaxID=6604 RepID=UPI0022E82080|nr:leucine-rich repeat-containing protein 24-like [Mya arenaria]
MCSLISYAISFLLTLTLLLTLSDGAYQSPHPCPQPCRCLFFEGLQSVYCNRTGITAVPRGIPADTQLLELSGNSIGHISVGDMAGLVNLQQLYLSSIGLLANSVDNGALDLPKLDTIDMSGNNLYAIPTFLSTRMITLWFLDNHLTELRSDSFFKYGLLQYLDLSYNTIKNIQPGTFNPLKQLETLYIPFNNLTDSSFPPNVFLKNSNLQLLSVRFNQLRHTLRDLPPSMTDLDYVGNQITTLPAYGFRSLPNLKTLAFWQGQVTTIEDYAFYGLPNVTIVDFMQDMISSTITNNTFTGLSGLQTIYLDLNQISKLEPGALYPLKSLNALWMSDNNVTTLSSEALDSDRLPQLSTVYIDGNPWNCDCHLRWLRSAVDHARYAIQDPHLITCASPPPLAGKAWDQLKPSDFVCKR